MSNQESPIRVHAAELPGAIAWEMRCGNNRALITTQLMMLRSSHGAGEGQPLWVEGVSQGGEVRASTDSQQRATVRLTGGLTNRSEAAQTVHDFDAETATLISQELDGAGEPLGDPVVHVDNELGGATLARIYRAVFDLNNPPAPTTAAA